MNNSLDKSSILSEHMMYHYRNTKGHKSQFSDDMITQEEYDNNQFLIHCVGVARATEINKKGINSKPFISKELNPEENIEWNRD